jgi:DNA-binding winged helix-turn-helix (wHTH) protein
VTVHVRRLREKIEADPANPLLLATVWGVGYRLDSPDGADQRVGHTSVEHPQRPTDQAVAGS